MSVRVQLLACHTPAVFFRAQLFICRPHRVYSSSSTRPSPGPSPCLFEHNRSCSPPLYQFERNRSPVCIAPAVSVRAQLLICRPYRVYSSASARPSLPPRPFERNRSPVTPTASIRVPALACHSHHVFSSAAARVPSPPYLFESQCLPCCVFSSTTARVSSPLYLLERQHSPVGPAMSIRAQPLARHMALACNVYAHACMHARNHSPPPRPVTGTGSVRAHVTHVGHPGPIPVVTVCPTVHVFW